MTDSKYRGRKFIITVLVYIATTVLAGMGKLDGAQIMSLYMTILGAYTLGNIAARQIEAKKE